MAAGSPWARDALLDAWAGRGDGGMAMVYRALFAQGWEPSPGSDPSTRVFDLRGNTAFLVLLAGVVLLVPRLVGRAPAARGVRTAAAVGTGVLVSLVGAVVSWAVVVFTDPAAVLVFGRDTGDAFALFAVDGLVFGTLLGLLTAVVHAGAGTAPSPGRRAARTRGGGTAVADDAPAAGDVAAPVATGREPGDATRYLCAAAYTDPAFARSVVDGVLGDRLGAVAVSPGVDLVPVARHSLTARRLRRERDRRLTVAYVVIALFGPAWLLFARLALSLLAAVSTAPVAYPAVRGRHLPRPSAWRLAAAGAGLLVTGAAAGAVLSAVPLPGVVRWLTGGYWYGVPPLLAVAVGVGLAVRTVLDEEVDVDARMRGALRRGAFAPDGLPRPGAVEPWAAARIAAVADAQRGNVRCHSGFSPFVGYGRRESEWTLSVPLLPAESERAVTDFDAWDVIARLRHRLAQAAGGSPRPRGPGPGAGPN
ncbi:hypothetical protein LUW75_22820 [Streptomyces sp. MRC013]|uniref:hypothetical protein n=1 Tax=Streptomyces sp. MRC013 TaxID=2898276 RepID=UPI00202654D2|nr:hypothetical protein [Streptomyces sp. MRC013]URM92318.1 hypothetical protein LUW75_22820 [Streptomyces sp. MRC013]